MQRGEEGGGCGKRKRDGRCWNVITHDRKAAPEYKCEIAFVHKNNSYFCVEIDILSVESKQTGTGTGN